MKFWKKRKPSATRRNARTTARLLKKYGILSVLVLGVAGAGLYGWRSGAFARGLDKIAQTSINATVAAGFRVDEILVRGRANLSPETLLAVLDIDRGTPILTAPVGEALGRISDIPWIETARVTRRLPDTIVVDITERQPAALWQYNKKIALIDSDGHVLETENLGRWQDLPMVVGSGADETAASLLALLQAEPELARQVSSAQRIGNRRWDLRLKNGITLRLPENEAGLALRQTAKLAAEADILNRNIDVIDLRQHDRIILTPGDNPATATHEEGGSDAKRI